jgi:hypothetical protein
MHTARRAWTMRNARGCVTVTSNIPPPSPCLSLLQVGAAGSAMAFDACCDVGQADMTASTSIPDKATVVCLAH